MVEGGIRSGRYERRRPCRKVAVLQKHSPGGTRDEGWSWCWRLLDGEAGASGGFGVVDVRDGRGAMYGSSQVCLTAFGA